MNLQTDAFLWLKGAGVLKETNPQPSRTHPGQVLLSAHANHGFETGQKVGEMLNLILRERGLQLPGESFQNFQKLSSPSSKAQNWNAISDLLRQHLRVELDEQAIPHILNGQSPGVVSQLVNELYDMQKEWKTEQSQNGSKSFPRPRKRMEGYRRKLALLKKSGFAQKTSSPPNITAFTPHSVTNRHHFCASRCASHEPPSGSGRSSPLRGILKTLRDPPGDPPSTPPTQKAHVAPSSLLHPPDIPTTSMTSSPYKSLNFNHQSHAPPAVSAAVASAAAAAASAAAATVSSFHSQHHLQRGTSFSPHEREDNFAPPDVSAHMHPSVYAPQLTTPRHPRPTNTPSQCHCGGGGDSPPFPRVAASSKSVAASRERVGVSGLAEPLRRGSSSSFEEPSAGLGGLAVASSAGAYALYGSSAFRSNAAAPLASAGASAPLPLPAASQLPSSPTRSFHTIPQTSRGPSSFPLQSQTSTHASRGRHSLPPIERQGTMQQSDAATAASLVPFSSLAPESPNLRFGSAKMSFNSRAVPDNPTSNASQAPPIRSALLPARLPAPPVASGWGASSDGRTSRAMQTDENFFVHGGSSQEKSSKVVTSKNSEVQQEEGGLLPAEDGVEVLTSEVDPVTSKARSTEAFLVLTLASSLQLGEADAEGWLRGNGRELGEAFESSGGNWAVCGNRGVDLREWLAALSGSFQQLCELIVEDPSTLFGALCIVEQGMCGGMQIDILF
uniref:Uncharacterized protein n=1 Tax=Chromera velia CCMP2878 TaxID=1169474 RepID=A0A0K6S8J5_9ALVE|eukprot:Cvel_5958.t1-p1 / transcript=Cvel_5958.t1 / gene=Cvel_5958 / organism=Chromera_velia_CCMP2878 / gene_product=hypothetical protein / transcript_product=hypothetical protein / location=Cvel_scaffold285:43550-45730(-) / protein_length=727 / sequence_SO=supercontig / SO=protein_coding / is_pseudo=false